MKILYITQTFPPEPGSTQRPLKQAICLQKLGCQLTVITTMPYYPLGKIFKGYRWRFIKRENIQGIDVVRIWSVPASNRGKLGRIISQVSFAITASTASLFIQRHQLVIASVPNIGTEIAGLLAARFKKSKLLLELRDLIPDNLALIGIPKKSFLARILFIYFRWIYRKVDLIAVPGKNMAVELERFGVTPERILILPHAADPEQIFVGSGREVRQKLHLDENFFVVLYAGSFSCYYDVPNLVAAASLLRQQFPHLHVVLVGTGPDREKVEHMIAETRPGNVTLVDPVPPDEIGSYLQAADLFISTLVGKTTPKAYQDCLITKVCQYLAAGKPVIAVENAPVCGDLLKRIGAGFPVPGGQPEALAKGIAFFVANKADAVCCGENGKRYARDHLERQKVVEGFYNQLVRKLALLNAKY